MIAASQPRWVKGSTTAVTMWSARNTTAVRERLRWRPVVRKRGQLGTSKRSEDRMPSTTTALKSTSETAPAPLVVYQRTVSFISAADQDPPETATPEPDEELTCVGEAWRLVEEVPVEVEVLAVAPEEEVA